MERAWCKFSAYPRDFWTKVLLGHLGRGEMKGGSEVLAEKRNLTGQPLSTPRPALLGRLTLPEPHLFPQPHTFSWGEPQLGPPPG